MGDQPQRTVSNRFGTALSFFFHFSKNCKSVNMDICTIVTGHTICALGLWAILPRSGKPNAFHNFPNIRHCRKIGA